jgi:hypothetical protein
MRLTDTVPDAVLAPPETRLRKTVVVAAAVLVGLALTACGERRLNVMQSPNRTLVTTGYSAERSQSIFRANNEALEYCDRREGTVTMIRQETVYEGQYDEDLTSAGRVAGRVAGALGSNEAANASRALSSPTDYKTTLEFLCD